MAGFESKAPLPSQLAWNHPATLCVAPAGLGVSVWGAQQAGHLHLPSLLPCLTPYLFACLMDLASAPIHCYADKQCGLGSRVAVPHTQPGWEGQGARVWPQPRQGAALALWQPREYGCPGPHGSQRSGPPTLLRLSGPRLCPGRQCCPWERWGLPAPGRATAQPLLSAGNVGTVGQRTGTACPGQG